jgi:hypothetical protein
MGAVRGFLFRGEECHLVARSLVFDRSSFLCGSVKAKKRLEVVALEDGHGILIFRVNSEWYESENQNRTAFVSSPCF